MNFEIGGCCDSTIFILLQPSTECYVRKMANIIDESLKLKIQTNQQKECIRKNIVILCESIDTGAIIEHLNDVLSNDQLSQIKAIGSPMSKNHQMLSFIQCKSQYAYHAFHLALVKTDQSHLAALLEPGLSSIS